jgi:hypothetical protein
MDVLRAHAYLDLINDRPAAARIATAEPQDDPADAGTRPGPGPDPRPDPGPDPGPGPGPGRGPGRGPGGPGPGPDDPDPRPGVPPAGQARQRPPADLIVPLTTLLGLTERPGEIHGFGLLDPALARQLAAAAAASPRTEICVTATSPEGYAIGHGCARPARKPPPTRPARAGPAGQAGPAASPAALPARLNLTIPAAALPSLTRPEGYAGLWAFTPHRKQAGTPGGFGTWTLTLPGDRQLTVRLDPVPTLSCDHRYESSPTSSTQSPMTKAAKPARATPAPAAAPATRSNSRRGGKSPSRNRAGTDGRPHPAASTCKNQSDTRPDCAGTTWPAALSRVVRSNCGFPAFAGKGNGSG